MLDLFLAVTKPLKKCLGRGGGGLLLSSQGFSGFSSRVLGAHVPGQNMKAAGA